MAARDTTQDGKQRRTLHGANGGTCGEGNGACALRIDAFCHKTLIEFIDAAKNRTSKDADPRASQCAGTSTARPANSANGCAGNGGYSNGSSAADDSTGSLACECSQGVDGITDNVTEFRGACAGTGITGRHEFADTAEGGSRFGGAYCGSAGLNSARNCAKLAPELLAETFTKAFDGHFAAQRRPLGVHVSVGGFFGRSALHPNNTPIRKCKVESSVRHELLLLLRCARILQRSSGRGRSGLRTASGAAPGCACPASLRAAEETLRCFLKESITLLSREFRLARQGVGAAALFVTHGLISGRRCSRKIASS